MKTSCIILLVLVLSISASAQEQTLMGGTIDHGGFGGPMIKVGQIKGEGAILVGGRGGWIINHTFVLGGGGYGLVNEIKIKEIGGTNYYLAYGYGGLELEYIHDSDNLVHYTIHTLFGGGSLNLRTRSFDMDNRQGDLFFIVEPGASIDFNVTSFFRFGVGASYTFVSGVNFENLQNSDFGGLSGVITFKFGKF
jgi:hypothetical protein